MKDIQEVCDFIAKVNGEPDDFKNYEWSAWLTLPNTKCFMDWLLANRLEITMRNMDSLHSDDKDKFFKTFYKVLGKWEMIGEIIDTLQRYNK